MKVICYAVAPLEDIYIENWAKKNDVEVKILREDLNEETVHLAEGFDGISSEGIEPVTEEVYAQLEKFGLKQLAIRQVGFDNQDLEAAKKHGIKITNVASYSPRAIAEMGVTHAMYLLRQVGIYYDRMNHGNFNFEERTLSREIFNCTVGLIGGGHIGGATAQIYSALSAKVLLFDPYYDAALEPFVEYTDLDTIFKKSDIISLHTPLLPSTANIINAESISKMEKQPILINMARGGLVDTSSLIDALKSGKISGAGLDTLANEAEFFGKEHVENSDLPDDYKELVNMDNVLITPHVAFFTKLAVKNSIEIALNDMKSIINGKGSKNIVNL